MLLPSLLALAIAGLLQEPPMKVGSIELFGHTGLDEKAIFGAVKLKVGDELTPANWQATQEGLRDAVRNAIGKPATDVAIVGFDENGRMMVFIGVPGPTVKQKPYRSLKGTTAKLHKQATDLYRAFGERLMPALQAGGGIEDDSKGYALFSDPELRSIQLKMRAYAVKNETLVRNVLAASKDDGQRAAAAQILGYANHSKGQIQALLKASNDPNDTVRNDATRALIVIHKSDPKMRPHIPAGPFIDMVRSGVWTDRNKGAGLLDAVTRTRRPELLKRIREEAVPSLLEMARWRSNGHNVTARWILGRVAGMTDEQIEQSIASGNAEEIFRAVGG